MILRIALGLARNSAPEHRWRRVAVPITAALFMLLVLAGISVVMMIGREVDRETLRSPAIAQKTSTTDLILLQRDDVWDGKQFFVNWIEPASKAEPVLPPGLERLPEPGQAVVSPALDRLASHHPDVAARYPNRLVLDKEGIRSEEELFAYVRVQEGRTLKEDESALRVHGFGPQAGGSEAIFSPDVSSGVPIAVVFVGVLGFLVLPGLVVLAVGAAAASEVRDRRFETLRWIGAPKRMVAALSVFETMILAVPAMVLVAALWALAAPRLGWVPLVGHDAVRGDLGLPLWLIVAALVVCVVVTGVTSVSTAAVLRRRRQSDTRPDPGRASITPFRAIPLVLVLVAFGLGIVNRGSVVSAYFYVSAMALAVIAVPLVLPYPLRAISAKLGRLESIPVSVAGRGLEWDPTRAVRPFAGVASLVVIALVGSMFISLAGSGSLEESPAISGDTQAVFVTWRDARPDDLDLLDAAVGSAFVAPLTSSEQSGGSILTIAATCGQVAPYITGTRCAPGEPYELPLLTERKLMGMLAPATYDPNAKVRLASAKDIKAGSAVVIDKAPLAVLEDRARTAAGKQGLPAPYVLSLLAFTPQEPPLAPWMIGGVSAAVIALGIGCLISLVDRLLGTRKHRRHLLNLGASSRKLMALEIWQFAAPFGIALMVSFSVGFAISVLTTAFSDASMPWRAIGATLGVAIATGVVGAASMAFFGAKGVRENPD